MLTHTVPALCAAGVCRCAAGLGAGAGFDAGAVGAELGAAELAAAGVLVDTGADLLLVFDLDFVAVSD